MREWLKGELKICLQQQHYLVDVDTMGDTGDNLLISNLAEPCPADSPTSILFIWTVVSTLVYPVHRTSLMLVLDACTHIREYDD